MGFDGGHEKQLRFVQALRRLMSITNSMEEKDENVTLFLVVRDGTMA